MDALLLIAFLILLALNVAAWFVIYQLTEQRGRMLLRLDALEKRLTLIEHHSNGVERALIPMQTPTTEAVVGNPLPRFSLPDLNGKMIGLDYFTGQHLLLVHWNPLVPSCKLIASDLAHMQRELQDRNVRMIFVSEQDGEANRQLAQEKGLDCPILLGMSSNYPAIFQNREAPVAYFLDETGLVIYPLAIGARQVLTLARDAATGSAGSENHFPPQHSAPGRLEREGIKAGTEAPSFDLPDIYGERVSLETYRGKKVFLVFSDPHCGPCEYLSPHLARLYREIDNNLFALIMIGRGDPAENRDKAELHDFSFPVALQKRWEISKLYGIFATPVAFLIDDNGIVAREIAKGIDEILVMFNEELHIEQEKQHD
jgi:peroxiredoxin